MIAKSVLTFIYTDRTKIFHTICSLKSQLEVTFYGNHDNHQIMVTGLL